LQVDGGITRSTAARAIAAGADVLVAGSATFADGNYGENIAALRGTPNAARNARKGAPPAAASGD